MTTAGVLSERARSAIAGIAAAGRRLIVTWPDGRESGFPFAWLRDNCPCPACRHASGQRLLDLLDLPPDPRPRSATLAPDGAVELAWEPDGHASRYAAGFLTAHDPDPEARARRQRAPALWDAAIAAALPRADWTAVARDPVAEHRALALLAARGFVILESVPPQSGMVVRVGERLGHVRVTNYGRHFDVVSVPDPNNLAYTALALAVHTDNPYRDPTPGLQLLHCLEQEAPGGETILVDGFRAAERLRRDDPGAFELLARIPVPFRFADAHADLRARAPVIACDGEGRVRAIRFNHRSAAPLDLAADLIERWYAAYRRFALILRDPEGELRFRLAPGELLIMDNERTLHGRTAFDRNAGRRHLQGCYLDKDGVWSRLRVLARELGREEEAW